MVTAREILQILEQVNQSPRWHPTSVATEEELYEHRMAEVNQCLMDLASGARLPGPKGEPARRAPPVDPGGSASSDRGLPLEVMDTDAGSALGWDEDYGFDVVQPTETTTTTTAKTANLWSRLVSEESLRKLRLRKIRKIMSRWRKFGAIAMVIMYSRTKGGRVLNWCKPYSVLTSHLTPNKNSLPIGGGHPYGLWPWPGF